MRDPFAPKIPSVFFIDSPFQAICAVASILQLQIEDFKIVVMLTNNSQRNSTILRFLEMRHLTYKTVHYNHFTYKWYQLLCLIKRPHAYYHRLFIGYFGAPFHHFAGCSMVADGADVIYLDDGVATLTLLNHEKITDITYFQEKPVIKKMVKRRGFDLYHHILTIYGDISNPKYNIRSLSLDLLNKSDKGQEKAVARGVYIVGTFSQSYCKQLCISEAEFAEKMDMLMANLRKKYGNEPMVFVPHRSDEGNYSKELCQKYDVEFRSVEMTVEIELQQQAYPPKVVVALTSSALYNLKKMFPQCEFINVLFTPGEHNKPYDDFLAISSYYEQNGIEMVQI